MLVALFAPGVIDQDAAHGLGGSTEEVRAVLPIGLLVASQPEPGFVYERSGLKRLAGGFAGHLRGGKFAQFAVNERQQLVGGLGVTLLDAIQDEGDFRHPDSLTSLRIGMKPKVRCAGGSPVRCNCLDSSRRARRRLASRRGDASIGDMVNPFAISWLWRGFRGRSVQIPKTPGDLTGPRPSMSLAVAA